MQWRLKIGVWKNLTLNYNLPQNRKRAKSTPTRESVFGTVLQDNFNYPLYIEKAVASYNCKRVFELVFFLILELQGSWKRRGKDIEESGARQGGRTLFSPYIPFWIDVLPQYTSSISNDEQALQDIVEREADEEQQTRLFQCSSRYLTLCKPSSQTELSKGACIQL